MKYNLEIVKKFIQNNDFIGLNEIINTIINKEEHNFKDLEILKCILDSSTIAFESKEKLKFLYLKYKKEIEERIFSGISSMSEETKNMVQKEQMINLKPLVSVEKNSAFINLKTIVLIVVLTILVIVAVSFLTLRG